MEKCYICCDLKSFYASVECVERGLDPMTTNLVVADQRRTAKTICLAVSPSLKAYGISGRARLFEVVEKVREVNAQRKWQAPGHQLTGSSWHDPDLRQSPELALDYIVAPPRMAHYIEWSTRIYQVYLKYAAPEDIHVYSIDEVFIDATSYLEAFQMTGGSWPGPSFWIFSKPPASLRRRESEPISISPRSPWTSKPSMSRQMNTGCGLPSWMK